MNAEHLIAHARQTSEISYRDAVPEDKVMLDGIKSGDEFQIGRDFSPEPGRIPA